MKKTIALVSALAIAASMVPTIAGAGTGNGAPSGAHYNLNIIGVPKGKTADMTSGNRIFVKLWGTDTKIMLQEGDDFQVLDANGTDGTAKFQLPNPDPNNTGTTMYSVFARALGKPGGKADMTTCATNPGSDGVFGTTDDYEECSVAVLHLERTKGKQSFENVSKELLYIYADIDEDGDLERVSLFDESLQGYFWDYDNNGLKLVQLRFYECSSTVPAADDPEGATTDTCERTGN